MSKPSNFAIQMRVIHRYLGFFLAGIMFVYALSGIVLIFRDTDALKKTEQITKQLEPNIAAADLGQALGMRKFNVDKEEGDFLYFRDGKYNKSTGEASYVQKELPVILGKMTHLHKAKSSEPLFFLNIFFGLGLLFFVLSSFWMFMPNTSIFRKGMYFTIGGIVLTLVLLFL